MTGAACMLGLGACGAGSAPDGVTAAPTSQLGLTATVPAGDWPTFGFTAQRSSVGPARTGISASTVHSLHARVVHIDGTVDASAVELHGVTVGGRRHDAIFVTTTYGKTIAIDPGSGRRLWEFTPGDYRTYAASDKVTDTTPVADPGRRFIYAVTPDGFVHKLAVASGREVRAGGWPARITWDPTREKMDSPLGVSGSSVIATSGGYIGDAPFYQGHVVLIDRASGRITHVFNTLCSQIHTLIRPPGACHQSDSAIWGRAGVVVEPRGGRLLLSTGNADFNGRTDWGDSVLELSPALALLHNWTPTDQAQLNNSDTDLGSSSPVLLPVVGGRRLLVQGGKDAKLHLLDLDRLDGTAGPAGPRLGGELQEVPTPGDDQLLTAPAVWRHRGRDWLFVGDGNATAAYTVTGGAHPRLHLAWQNGSAGTSPVLAGGLLYVYDPGGALNVYAPVSGRRLVSLAAGSGHWNSPIVVGGRIILPVGSYHDRATSGEIDIWQR